MSQLIKQQQLRALIRSFISPILEQSKHVRQCPELTDLSWVEIGVGRVLEDAKSGRAYLQTLLMLGQQVAVSVSHFFESLKSSRRLNLVKDVNIQLAQSMPTHPHSSIDDFKELGKIDIYAGDGHYHKAAAHDKPVCGKLRAVGHFFSLNMRTMAMTLLAAADLQGGKKKSEHDMHALKRLGQSLRQGAKKGRQVLYVWDCAGIDIGQWYKWKQQHGIYFLSLLKDNFKLTIYGQNKYEDSDPVNRGVLSDQLVTGATGGTCFRLVRYRCPSTGKVFSFITNHMKIRPGVIAWLYLRRWDIEKSFDCFKNKFDETKAWASSTGAKAMQAHFIAMAHNLCVLLEEHLIEEHQLEDEKETKRCEKRNQQARELCQSNGYQPAPMLYSKPQRRSQFCIKFIRWLRHHLRMHSFIEDAVSSLRSVYQTF